MLLLMYNFLSYVILGYMMLHTFLQVVILLHNLLLYYRNMLSIGLVHLAMQLHVHFRSNLMYYFLFVLPNSDLTFYKFLNLFHLVYTLYNCINLYRLLSSLLLDILCFYLRIFLLCLHRIFCMFFLQLCNFLLFVHNMLLDFLLLFLHLLVLLFLFQSRILEKLADKYRSILIYPLVPKLASLPSTTHIRPGSPADGEASHQ